MLVLGNQGAISILGTCILYLSMAILYIIYTRIVYLIKDIGYNILGTVYSELGLVQYPRYNILGTISGHWVQCTRNLGAWAARMPGSASSGVDALERKLSHASFRVIVRWRFGD